MPLKYITNLQATPLGSELGTIVSKCESKKRNLTHSLQNFEPLQDNLPKKGPKSSARDRNHALASTRHWCETKQNEDSTLRRDEIQRSTGGGSETLQSLKGYLG
ncbi:hypothetical protein KC19_4G238700 [Ceratodon purpureus]|uniref:Uncharacterized protein n=1 Tax=Ceratodon purpureus TaxID=3225 RepID=A0A8T0IEG5_CERPU|nr:hypothetical protein KC19_4G238700 [Ceratodon purpureus]